MGPLNNILRDKVPSAKDDTVGPDVSILVKTFAKGMVVDVHKVKPEFGVARDEPDYGYCVFPVGDINMTAEQVLTTDTAKSIFMPKPCFSAGVFQL